MNSVSLLFNSASVSFKETFNLDLCEKCSDKVREVADRISSFCSNVFSFITFHCTNFFKSASSAVYELFLGCVSLSIDSMRTRLTLCRERLQKMEQTPIENVDRSFINDLSSLAAEALSLIISVKTREELNSVSSEELDFIYEEALVIKEAVSSLVADIHEKLKENRPKGVPKPTELQFQLLKEFLHIIVVKDPEFYDSQRSRLF